MPPSLDTCAPDEVCGDVETLEGEFSGAAASRTLASFRFCSAACEDPGMPAPTASAAETSVTGIGASKEVATGSLASASAATSTLNSGTGDGLGAAPWPTR